MKPESNLGGLLGKASRLLANDLNTTLKVHGLTVEQWTLLAVLWGHDALKQKELQAALLKDKATINSLVSYLVKDGFVHKKQDELDKRSVVVSLTPKGKEMQFATVPLTMKSITKATADIDEEALQVATTVLQQLIHNLTKETS